MHFLRSFAAALLLSLVLLLTAPTFHGSQVSASVITSLFGRRYRFDPTPPDNSTLLLGRDLSDWIDGHPTDSVELSKRYLTSLVPPAGFRYSWGIDGYRLSYGSATGAYITRSTLTGATTLGQAEVTRCGRICAASTQCGFFHPIQMSGGREGAVLCALYTGKVGKSAATFANGTASFGGTVVVSYGFTRNVVSTSSSSAPSTTSRSSTTTASRSSTSTASRSSTTTTSRSSTTTTSRSSTTTTSRSSTTTPTTSSRTTSSSTTTRTTTTSSTSTRPATTSTTSRPATTSSTTTSRPATTSQATSTTRSTTTSRPATSSTTTSRATTSTSTTTSSTPATMSTRTTTASSRATTSTSTTTSSSTPATTSTRTTTTSSRATTSTSTTTSSSTPATTSTRTTTTSSRIAATTSATTLTTTTSTATDTVTTTLVVTTSTTTSTSTTTIPAPTYSLINRFQGRNFYDNFYFFTYSDPTNGYVDYIGRSEASSLGLISATGSQVYMGYAQSRIWPPVVTTLATNTTTASVAAASTATASTTTSSSTGAVATSTSMSTTSTASKTSTSTAAITTTTPAAPALNKRQASTSTTTATVTTNVTSTTTTTTTAPAETTTAIPAYKAVRVSSFNTYTEGIFVLDASHIPVGCGLWPAFWTVPTNPVGSWPNGGEIDIVEGIHDTAVNTYSIHTARGCSVNATTNVQLGSWSMSNLSLATNCASQDTGNMGCGVRSNSRVDYGTGYNANGGGVHAMVWDSDVGIRAYFWPRTAMPADLAAEKPDPSLWGTPIASWPATNCDIERFFANHVAVFTNTICGDWAGTSNSWNNVQTIYGQTRSCAAQTGFKTCQAYMESNPDMSEAYWLINSVKIFQTTRRT